MTFQEALRRAYERARAGAQRPGDGDDLVSIEGSMDLDPESVFSACSDENGESPHRLLWDTRSSSALKPELVVGLGAVGGVIRAEGARRFSELRDSACALLGGITPFAGNATPRVFGGFAFEPVKRGPFQALGDASFVLPRWTLRQVGRAAKLDRDAETQVILVVRRGELEDMGALVAEVRSLAALRARAEVTSLFPPAPPSDDASEFVDTVRLALRKIEEGEFEKVVVARALELDGAPSPERVLRRLRGAERCVRYGFVAGDAAFIAATPELLVARDARGARTEALAGSEPRRGHDAAESQALLGRDKDLREHEYVVRAIRENLEAVGATVMVDAAPSVRTLRHVHHLATRIRAGIPGSLHVCDLVEALHPTPAMGGMPRQTALSFLRTHEREPRGWYAAPFGCFDAEGFGEFVVGIRSALLRGDRAWVFAGAGIVAGSDPQLEVREVACKQVTMRDALGIGPNSQATTNTPEAPSPETKPRPGRGPEPRADA